MGLLGIFPGEHLDLSIKVHATEDEPSEFRHISLSTAGSVFPWTLWPMGKIAVKL